MKTRHWIIYLLVWVAYFSVLFLTSCKTKTVTQEHYITDNTVSKGLDAIWQERFISAFEQMATYRNREHETSTKETTHTKDSTSTTVDQNGKPIKTESWHSVVTNRDTKEVTKLQDSISTMSKEVDKYQLLIVQKDSLIRLKQDSIHVLSRELTKAEINGLRAAAVKGRAQTRSAAQQSKAAERRPRGPVGKNAPRKQK